MRSPKEARKQSGMTLQQVYDAHNIATNFVSQIENGIQQAYGSTRKRLEEVYGTKVNWLDVPITPKPVKIGWYKTELKFRVLLNNIAGLPDDERDVFVRTCIKQLRDCFDVI